MKIKKYRYFVGDFETTVYDGQEDTSVWASACVELFTDDVKIFGSIEEQFEFFTSLDCNIVCYYHNLKFDGSFWLWFLLSVLKYKQAYREINSNEMNVEWLNERDMPNNSFIYSISEMGQWYYLVIKHNNRYIELRDSLKLLPFSVKEIGNSFKTTHKKLSMSYKGFRYPGCVITDDEKKYISNDVLVMKEALEIMYNQNNTKLTIGSCCLEEFKKTVFDEQEYKSIFPNIYEIKINEKLYGSETAGDYIRKSYRGGWCYVVKGKENKIYKNGCTADVNSLYPSMMHSQSGNYFPYGKPTFWHGNYIPNEAKYGKYFFIRIQTRFYLKKNKLPFIQVKTKLIYKSNECLETSDYYDKKQCKYFRYYKDVNGEIHDTKVILTMTMTDYKLFLEHYDVEDFEILDGCYFNVAKGLFDEYIDKYKKIKMESTGAIRQLAKLFLNNLCGKMATNTNSSFKVAFLKEDGSLGYFLVEKHDKKPGYIPIGSAITSYARNFTIRAAQANFYGVNKKGFIYADTDSIHCDLPKEKIKGIVEHPTEFCCWKIESIWDIGVFARQKTYIERVVEDDSKNEKPYLNIKCAGMPTKCKKLLEYALIKDKNIEDDIKNIDTIETEDEKVFLQELTEEEINFAKQNLTFSDFKTGLVIPGKLVPRNIRGGVLLCDTTYEMR